MLCIKQCSNNSKNSQYTFFHYPKDKVSFYNLQKVSNLC